MPAIPATTAAALPTLPAQAGLLVALGAIPGAWLRLQLVQQLAPRLGARHWATLGVNGSACLLLGVLVSLAPRSPAAPQLLLLLGTGFLGSFSTFSSFIAEWSQLLQRRSRRQAWALLVASLLLGLAATWLGLQIGSAGATATP